MSLDRLEPESKQVKLDTPLIAMSLHQLKDSNLSEKCFDMVFYYQYHINEGHTECEYHIIHGH